MIALILCVLIAGACAAPQQIEFSIGMPERPQPYFYDYQEGVEGTEYKITLTLPDFDEKDIVVKAREGLLMIKASHMYTKSSWRMYQDWRTLPDTVNVTGNWIFENGVLKITFPLKDAVVKSTEPITTTDQQSQFHTTVRPYFKTLLLNEGVQDVDVGLGRGSDLVKEKELKTNVIPDK